MKCTYICKSCNMHYYITKSGINGFTTKLKRGSTRFTESDYTELCGSCRKCKGECEVCGIVKYNQGITCSSKCAWVLKKKSYEKTCGTPHNFSKESKSRKEWEKKLIDNEGIINVFQRDTVKKKIKDTISMKYNNGTYIENISQSKHWRVKQMFNYIEKHGIDNFLSIYSDPHKLKRCSYYKNVWSITYSQLKKRGKDVLGMSINDIRDKNLSIKDYGNKLSVDHKFAISRGYEQGIDFKIIGSIHNLEILTCRENSKKGNRYCNIKLKELKQKYNEDKENS